MLSDGSENFPVIRSEVEESLESSMSEMKFRSCGFGGRRAVGAGFGTRQRASLQDS